MTRKSDIRTSSPNLVLIIMKPSVALSPLMIWYKEQIRLETGKKNTSERNQVQLKKIGIADLSQLKRDLSTASWLMKLIKRGPEQRLIIVPRISLIIRWLAIIKAFLESRKQERVKSVVDGGGESPSCICNVPISETVEQAGNNRWSLGNCSPVETSAPVTRYIF